MKRLFVLAACFCLVMTLPAFGMSEQPKKTPRGSSAKVGAEAPDFTLSDMNGESVSLSDYRGKVVFLNFWATWCPPCREEMPSMERLHETMGDKDFAILAVNVEKGGRQAVENFLNGSPYSFKILLDPQGSAQGAYRVYRFPETYLIDKDGKILQHFLGARNWSSVEFLKYLNDLIGK
ncbi:MAG: TlpA family protein disulfide reductase [Desulfuromonadales bacterium]|nr:TlpA family protein disulfide reductase [Desulfuromonadales bacterium]NIR33050.1 TlpA family protein disulfide reductase [Desulfuromonadales bacterium]NIS43069.1 TlpA family protein disulfide reductase [Desulfuromonadales bacterium]